MFAALAAGLMAVNMSAAEKSELTTPKQKASYAIGANIGKSMKAQGLDADFDMIAKGMKDAADGKPALNDDEMKEAMMSLQAEMQAKAAQAGEKAKGEGVAYLAANKSKEGVKATASGLQYKVMKEGKGAKPKASDTVKVHYRGTLIDGTEFDSSYKRGEPIEFPLNGVIPCWTEGVQKMKVGGKAKFTCPPAIAYGSRGAGRAVPPNATLNFDVELLGIQGR